MKKKPLLIIVSICSVILIGVGAVWFATQLQPTKVESHTSAGIVKNTNDWAGTWYRIRNDGEPKIIISKVSSESFGFELCAQWLDRSDPIHGVAKYSRNYASCYQDNEKIQFSLNDGELTVEAKDVKTGIELELDFNGVYSKIPPEKMTLAQLKVLPDQNTDSTFRKFIGKDYNLFRDAFGDFKKVENLDDFKATVVSGFGRRYNGAIIMIGTDGKFWAAYKPDPLPEFNPDNTIYYYTNDLKWNTRLPKTILDWRNRFDSYKQVVYVDKDRIESGVYPVLVGYLVEGNRDVIYDCDRVLIKSSAGIKSLTNDSPSPATRPAVDPHHKRCTYVFPVGWEVGDVYVYDPHLDTSEIILSQKNFPPQTNPKEVCWLDEWRIAVIIGPVYGSIAEGGDIYIFDTRSRQLTLAVKADEGTQFKDIFNSGDSIVAEQVSYADGAYSKDEPVKFIVYEYSELLRDAGMR